MAAYDLSSSPYWKTYATIAAAVSGVAAEIAAGRGAFRSVRCGTAGVLVITHANATTTDALDFLAGEKHDVRGTAITAAGSSDAIPIVVFW